MATRTLLAGNRTLTTDGREEQHARLMEPYRRIDDSVHASQSNIYTGGPANRLDDTRLRAESRYPSDHTQKTLYAHQNAVLPAHLGGVDYARTGSISGQIDQSRRTSELQSISDARMSSGELFFNLLFFGGRKSLRRRQVGEFVVSLTKSFQSRPSKHWCIQSIDAASLCYPTTIVRLYQGVRRS